MINLAKIVDLCHENNISVRKLALKLGWPTSTLQAMIDHNHIKLEKLETIAAFFGVPITVFFNEISMSLKDYQDAAMSTCTPSSKNFAYMMLNLSAEVGEIAGKIAKSIRKEMANIDDNQLYVSKATRDNLREEVILEIGDVMWQVAGLAKMFNATLDEVCQKNLEKLADRQKRGTIVGEGDHR